MTSHKIYKENLATSMGKQINPWMETSYLCKLQAVCSESTVHAYYEETRWLNGTGVEAAGISTEFHIR